MLSTEENWLNIWAIQYLSYARVIPVQIDRETGKIRVLKDITALLAWVGYVAAVQFHSLHGFYCCAKLFGKDLKGTAWALPYHYYKIFVPQVATLVVVVPFLLEPDVIVALFNNSVGKMGSERLPRKRKSTRVKQSRKFWNLSSNEMVTVLLPIASFPTGLLLLAGVTAVDFWPLTFEKLLTVSSSLKILADGVAIFSWVSWAYFTVHFQFLFLEKVNYSLKREMVQTR